MNTLLSQLAGSGSFVIANETLYQVCEKRDGRGYADELQCGLFGLGLVPSGMLRDIENFYRSRNRREIFGFKKQFVQEGLQKELMSGQNIKDYDNVKCALKFILEEFLPLMIDTAYEMGELLGVPNNLGVKTGRQCIDDIVKEEIGLMESEDPTERIQRAKKVIEQQIAPPEGILRWELNFNCAQPKYNGNTSTLGSFTDGVPLYFSRGHVFTLTHELNDVVFVIDGKKYSPHTFVDVESFDDLYHKEFMKVLRRESLQDFDAQAKQMAKDSVREKGFRAFACKQSFSYGNLGYVRKGDDFYVYWEVPKFAMQNPVQPALCNPYPPAKVGLKINASGGKVFRSEAAYCIDPMIHPTLRNWEEPFVHICNLSGNFRGHSAKNAMADLSDGINSFINGLTMESLTDHGSPDEDCRFYGKSLKSILEKVGYIRLEDAMARGFKITNVWNHKEYNEALAAFKDKQRLEEIAEIQFQRPVEVQTSLETAGTTIPEDARITPNITTPNIETNRLGLYYERTMICARQYKRQMIGTVRPICTNVRDIYERTKNKARYYGRKINRILNTEAQDADVGTIIYYIWKNYIRKMFGGWR